jgi:hypothetical protein
MQATRREDVYLLFILDLSTKWGERSASYPAALTLDTSWIGGRVGIRAVLDTEGLRKGPLPGIEPLSSSLLDTILTELPQLRQRITMKEKSLDHFRLHVAFQQQELYVTMVTY